MTVRVYDNLDVVIDRDGDAFRARVVSSPAGEAGPIDFALPLTEDRRDLLLARIEPGRVRSRRLSEPNVAAAEEYGAALFAALFRENLRDVFIASLRRRSGSNLRIRLRVNDAPTLAAVPWELLYDRSENNFFALSERTPIVRYLELPYSVGPVSVDGPLNLLVITSSPTDLAELDVDAEWGRITDALGPARSAGTITISRLSAPTMAALHDYLRRHEVHVLHFIGHGAYSREIQDGVLYFADGTGRSRPVSSSLLGPYVRDHESLRLVVLNACQTGRADELDPFSGVAQGLVQQGAPAVVAMQFPVTDGAAIAFANDFYTGLSLGQPVDQVMSSARKVLLAEYGTEWATPVLFLRAPDGELFDIRMSRTVVEAAKEAIADFVPSPDGVTAATLARSTRSSGHALAKKAASVRETEPVEKAVAATKATTARKGITPRAPIRPEKATPMSQRTADAVPAGSAWTEAELSGLRAQLADELTEMRSAYDSSMRELDDLQRPSTDGADDDQADAGSKFEYEQEQAIAANRFDLITQIQHAMERIDNGTYGFCERCGKPIPKARLMAFPAATVDVACKQRDEQGG